MSRLMDGLFEELKVNKLPALPHVIVEILDACQSENADFSKMSEIICRDAVMAAKLISIANSASYFQTKKVTSINRALLLIGTEQVKTIALTVAVQQFFSEFGSQQTEYLKTFWTCSLRCALLAKALATLTGFPGTESAYLTGLLHNIGELALRTNFPDEYIKLDNLQKQNNGPITELENIYLKTSHCEFGAWLVNRWGLGEFASAAIKYHHEIPSLVLDAHHLVKIVYVASHLSASDQFTQKQGIAAAGKLFDLTPELMGEINQKIRQEVATIATSLHIELKADETDAEGIHQKDEEKQIKLAKHVRNISLLNTAKEHLDTSQTLSELHRAVEETAFMLFGYSSARILLIDEETQLLRYLDFNSNDRHAMSGDEPDLEIPLHEQRSIMATAIIDDKVISSAEWSRSQGKLPIVDQHMLSLLNSPHMVCIPIRRPNRKQLSTQVRHLGLLALGSPLRIADPQPLSNMLTAFADNVGDRLQRAKKELEVSGDILTSEQQHLRLREINHEISNPLTIIRNYLDILSGRLADESTAQQEIVIIQEEIDRAGKILLRLSETDLQQDTTSSTDINKEINGLIKLFSASLFITHEINCSTELDDKLKPQILQRSYVRQILVNLIKNAVEAMPRGGDLLVSTNHQVNFNGRQYVELTVSDTGPGLDEASIARIFEPGNSGKKGQHAGLGLSITQSLVAELCGTISCRNTKTGAQFQVLLPAKVANDVGNLPGQSGTR